MYVCLFLCVQVYAFLMLFISFFVLSLILFYSCIFYLLVCFLKRKRRWKGRKDLEGNKGGKTKIRIYCIKITLISIKINAFFVFQFLFLFTSLVLWEFRTMYFDNINLIFHNSSYIHTRFPTQLFVSCCLIFLNPSGPIFFLYTRATLYKVGLSFYFISLLSLSLRQCFIM